MRYVKATNSIILEVGDKVVQDLPDIGDIHGEIETIISQGGF